MTSSTKPTILLIQGSFQLPEIYSKLVTALEARGYPVAHPVLPSTTGHDEPDFASRSLVDDALTVQRQVEQLVEQEGKIVVALMHSYGGLVGTEGIPRELSWEARKQHGQPGGVLHLFFFSAFVFAEGQSIIGLLGEAPNTVVKPNGRFTMENAGRLIYNDLPAEEAAYWESKIIDQSYAVQTTELTRAAYRYIPSTYAICELDQALSLNIQEKFAEAADADVIRLNAGHSPMLSIPEELADLIAAASEGALKRTGLAV
ncbi:putative hydrolase R7-like protein [Cladobotryum mycophilum]|uniref:Hydrolase R7-like protein n=1 Tax=Cladobotryum mycophilum TaxID=491253 RepID=A0ABR0SVC7_9HYPO